jgi:hypothetical protein
MASMFRRVQRTFATACNDLGTTIRSAATRAKEDIANIKSNINDSILGKKSTFSADTLDKLLYEEDMSADTANEKRQPRHHVKVRNLHVQAKLHMPVCFTWYACTKKLLAGYANSNYDLPKSTQYF